MLELAVVGGYCDWATIRLRATKWYAAVTITSDLRDQGGVPESVGERETTKSREYSVHGVELAAGRESFGVIGFYAAHAKGFTATGQEAARLVAIQAALTIGAVRSAAELSYNIKLRDIAHDVVTSGRLPAGRPRRKPSRDFST
ncbi:hypothetical protein AB0P21_41250 [Kribbella sp. NPDC056861]|uniref:hypothetical protein n=1 Tax=Kribbella sp. NPDC056861 TaxID=3154857 RepID=UPI00341DAA3D